MAKMRTVFRCMECGHSAPKWAGQCSGCAEWNSLVEEVDSPVSPYAPVLTGMGSGVEGPALASSRVQPMTEVCSDSGQPVSTGIDELDRVLGGGFVPGSVTLLGGEPGVGKSTLVLQILAAVARKGSDVLYITGEESAGQVRSRAERLDAVDHRIAVVSSISLPDIMGHLSRQSPQLCVIDSIQTIHTPELASAPGSVAQVRECAYRLVQWAKATSTTVVLVGHVTKDGNLAGPRVLEHMVDTVLNFEGDRHLDLRLLRAHKHRFGSTEELGLFSMTGDGLRSVDDPSGLFLGDRRPGIAGSVVTATLQGHRPVLAEIQSLASRSSLPNARRSAQGMDSGRLALLLAVLDSRLGVGTQGVDIYANAIGGIKVCEPGADLAICLSVMSTLRQRPVGAHVVACGEVGLGGELRMVSRLEHRLSEAARLGFSTAIVPATTPKIDVPIEVVRIRTLKMATAHLGLLL